MVRKPGKHQRSKQRCKDLGWKVHDPAKSFALHSYTMHELRNQHVFLLVRSLVRSKQLLCFVYGQGRKSDQKPTTKNFIGFHNHTPLLNVITTRFITIQFRNAIPNANENGSSMPGDLQNEAV